MHLSLTLAALMGILACGGNNGKAEPEEPEAKDEVVSEEVTSRMQVLESKGALTAAEATEYKGLLTESWKVKTRNKFRGEFVNKQIKIGDKIMPLDWSIYGNKRADGRSLYISLHGGGGTTAAVNDQQWNNQKRLYKPNEGVYLCPRAIDNTWDMHFMKGTDQFYERIIAICEAFLDVNPNKVYIMGYSAGGDGVWRLGPRLADHWAAASMMAGHPGDVGLVNLRNTPFMIWCGALDSAYERNQRCAERIEEMQALHDADPEGYDFEGHIVEGKEHWMDLVDAAAVPWMAARKRNPVPTKVVWCQEEGLRSRFYWIGAPSSEIVRGKTVIASYTSDGVITIEKSDYSRLTLYLDDSMFSLDGDVKVVYDGNTVFEGKVDRTAANMSSSLDERGDLGYIFPARIEVTLKAL